MNFVGFVADTFSPYGVGGLRVQFVWLRGIGPHVKGDTGVVFPFYEPFSYEGAELFFYGL